MIFEIIFQEKIFAVKIFKNAKIFSFAVIEIFFGNKNEYVSYALVKLIRNAVLVSVQNYLGTWSFNCQGLFQSEDTEVVFLVFE